MEDNMMKTAMPKNSKENNGLQVLIKKCRRMFRIPENVNYYSPGDFKRAEKKYLKHILNGDL
jgi:hypothetical protein